MTEVQEAVHSSVLDDSDPEVARNYSEALLNASAKSNEGNTDEILDELDAIQAEVFGRFPAFAGMLSGSGRSEASRDELLVRTLEGRSLPTVLQFLRVLNRHGRIGQLSPILKAARDSWNRRQNRIPVLVKSAVGLETSEMDALTQRLSTLIHGTPIVRLEIDPSLIGGLIVQVGDDVYDVSVRNRLEQLRHRLIEGKTHEIQSRRDHFSHSE